MPHCATPWPKEGLGVVPRQLLPTNGSDSTPPHFKSPISSHLPFLPGPKAHKAFVFLCPVAFLFLCGPCIYGAEFIAAVWRPKRKKLNKKRNQLFVYTFSCVQCHPYVCDCFMFFFFFYLVIIWPREYNTYSLCSWVSKRPSGLCIWCVLASGGTRLATG